MACMDGGQAAGGESAAPARTAGRAAVYAGRRKRAQGNRRQPFTQGRSRTGSAEPLHRPFHVHREHAGAAFQGDQRRHRVNLHHGAVVDDAPFRKKDDRPAGAQQAQHPLHAQRIVEIQYLVPDMGQQPAHEPAPGFIRRHDDHGFPRQEQRQHHGIEAGMVIGNDQQPVRMAERRQVAEDADAEQHLQQLADQEGHGNARRLVLVVMTCGFYRGGTT